MTRPNDQGWKRNYTVVALPAYHLSMTLRAFMRHRTEAINNRNWYDAAYYERQIVNYIKESNYSDCADFSWYDEDSPGKAGTISVLTH